MLENVIEGDEAAGEIISMLPDVVGVAIDFMGVAVDFVKSDMEQKDATGGHRGVYVHVHFVVWIPWWYSIHPN
jgi:hypothetical protein